MTYMTIEQFRQLHEEWKQSGINVQQYCENTGLKESLTLPASTCASQSIAPKFLLTASHPCPPKNGTYLGLTWDSHASVSGRTRECDSL